MHPSPNVLLLVAGLVAAGAPALAQSTPPTPRHAHRAVKPARVAAPRGPAAGGINTPSTDFSTLDRADDDGPATASGGSMRPVMGAGGNIGLGTGF